MKEFRIIRKVVEYTAVDNIAEEYFDIFIYSKLIVDKIPIDTINLTQYKDFHVYESVVTGYNLFYANNNATPLNDVDAFVLSHPDMYAQFRQGFYNTYFPKPIIWDERNHTGYYEKQLEESFLFELHIYLTFYKKGIDLKPYWDRDGQDSGENELGVEIKNDKRSIDTGNFYIEYAEKSNSDNDVYVPSGILKDDNTKFILIGVINDYLIFEKTTLIKVYNRQSQLFRKTGKTDEGYRFVSIKTSKGLLIRKNIANQIAISLDAVIESLK